LTVDHPRQRPVALTKLTQPPPTVMRFDQAENSL